MAKISLRRYTAEISALIDQGQIDEAIAHCHHILKTFPKNLEIYRLLGKAYLEAKRYNDAGDIFSRVLMSVPNDFVSHVGMSLIADEKKKQDEAIWHMERAFEAQPSNAAVQSELQRLYGQRDGVEPPQVHMTSGALANVYLQGELYPQAIAEIRSVDARDPNRLDMQVLLALAYFRSGQRVEASQIASNLLAKYPYCLDANRILVQILPGTSRADDAKTYRQRVNALDPYAAFTKDDIFKIDDVPDAAVSLEKLDWMPGSPSEFGRQATSAEESDWTPADAPDFEPATASGTPTEEEDIPDFMKAAGWGASSGAAEEPTSFFDDSDLVAADDDNGEIEKAELPAWMQEIAPTEDELSLDDESESDSEEWISDLLGDKVESTTPSAQRVENDDLPDWLQEADDQGEKSLSFSKDLESADGIPDWIQDNEPEAEIPAPPVADEMVSLGTSEDDQDAAMKWLESLAANQGAKPEELLTDPASRTEEAPEWVEKAKNVMAEPAPAPAAAEDEIPAWLRDDEEGEAEEVLDFLQEAEAEKASPVKEMEDDLDWLKADETEAEIPAPPVADEMASLGTSEDDQDAAMKWLESLAANQGAKPEELLTDPASRTEEAPEWVEKAKNVMAEPASEPAAAEDEIPAWLRDDEEGETEEVLDFLQEAEAEKASPVEEVEDDLDWLKADETEAEISAPPVADEMASLGTSEDDQDAAMKWLESLAANQGAKPEELLTDPASRTEEAPEWVEKAKNVMADNPPVSEPEAPPVEAEAQMQPSESEEETPQLEEDSADEDLSWLTEMETEKGQPLPDIQNQASPAKKDDGLPAWLADMGSEEEQLPATESAKEDLPDWLAAEEEFLHDGLKPTESSDWKPVRESAEDVDSEETLSEAQQVSPDEEKSFNAIAAKLAKTKAVPRREEVAEPTPPVPVQQEAPPQALEEKEERKPKPKIRRRQRTNTTMLRDITLMGAQSALDVGNIEAALKEYAKLIKKKRLLEETIYDLREALDEYPVNISIWQTLGDAYMRADRLQEAIDAYTNAEKLIR